MLTEFNKTHFVKVTSTGLFGSPLVLCHGERHREQHHDCSDQRGDAPASASGAHKTPFLTVRVSVPWMDRRIAGVDRLFQSCKIKAQTGALFPHEAMTDCTTCTK